MEVGETPVKKTRGRKKKEVAPPQDVVMEAATTEVSQPKEPEPVFDIP